ncbi:hypothetical protein AGDE_15697 [Angomonas deanei]|nr:hypothetical protein AGDE_15697 [Angomonas deanei]|eukprot:EPY18612.1 hypothetical protein AGDE_15697 [Angomonas deanei]
MALRYHPDKNIGDPSVVDTFRQVRVAYEVLGNTERKKKYDANLRLQKTLGTGARGRDYNPYMPTGPSGNFNASIYEEMRRQQEGKRATSTGRPGKTTTTTSNSYSKEQQELFRKKERERQAQLKKQREEEKRLQRERERESLRREQTRQEELLQRQWQQQQQRNLNTPRTARGRPARTGTPQPEDSPARAVDHTPDRVRVATPGRSGTPRQTSVGPRRVPSQKPTHKETRPTSAQPMRRQNSITSATTTEDSNASSYSPRPNFSAYTTTNTSGNPVHRTARGVRVADSPLRTASTERGSQQRADSRERKSSLGSNSVNPMSSPRVTLQRGNRPIRPNSSPSPATTPPPLKSTNGMNLSSGDREMLEKRRLDKVEKEKENSGSSGGRRRPGTPSAWSASAANRRSCAPRRRSRRRRRSPPRRNSCT